MSDFGFEIDDILAEFTAPASGDEQQNDFFLEQPAENIQMEERPFPHEYEQQTQPFDASWDEPLPAEEDRTRRFDPHEVPDFRQPYEESEEKRMTRADFNTEEKAKRKKKDKVPKEKTKAAKAEVKEPKPQKERKKPGRTAKAAISALGMVLSALCIVWSAGHIQPASGSAAGTIKKTDSIDISERINSYATSAAKAASAAVAQNAAAQAELEPPVRTRWVIPENALVAPEPDPAGFGKVPVANAAEIENVIQRARDSGLLGADERVIFDPSVEFNTGSYYEDIQYYIDDTLLVICWKEIIDGNTCTFCEAKVQDASQMRRKLAGDMFGSDVQEYTTSMHESTNAVVSMNADYYRFRDMGIVVYDRQLYRFNESEYCWRNGIQLQKYNCEDTLLVDKNGDFSFFHMYEQTSPEEMERTIAENDILFSIAFGPVLVENGQLNSSPDFIEQWYPVGEVNTGYSRAGIGQVDKLHYLYMSLNHSDEKQARWTVSEFGQHFFEKGVLNAYNLDGGQTSEIVFQGGSAYNHVDHVNGTNSRQVSDMIYFASALGGEEVTE